MKKKIYFLAMIFLGLNISIYAQIETDWGDAPEPGYCTVYPPGAYHDIVQFPGLLCLGSMPDDEPDGQPSMAALGDDWDILYPPGWDDEDGVILHTPVTAGAVASVSVSVQGTGYLNAWMDFYDNPMVYSWTNKIIDEEYLSTGSYTFYYFVPPDADPGDTYARFRFSSQAGVGACGYGYYGEVEDYILNIEPYTGENWDWGDAPDPDYPTLSSSYGARHYMDGVTYLGSFVDDEPDGQPSMDALGDDNDIYYPPPSDDEDGVMFTNTLEPGTPVDISVFASADGLLSAWMDFNQDGDWQDAGEQIFFDEPLVSGINDISFWVPASAYQGQTYARFRFSTQPGLWVAGWAPDGEVEDYLVTIEYEPEMYDWGDAPDGPYPTLNASNGARHDIYDGLLYLGFSFDDEPDGQPDPNALGDDNDGNDDEDGVTFNGHIIKGISGSVTVVAYGSGYLNTWMDFNADGDWDDLGEQIFTGQPLIPGPNSLTFAVPASATSGETFCRFRYSSDISLNYTGPAGDGEVEDYKVTIYDPVDFGDAPDGPYPTLLVNNGARHIIIPGIYLGNLGSVTDAESDGQPDANALGDDNDGNDDEDGVIMPATVTTGQTISVVVAASVQGRLNAWVDFNINGSWADPGEQIFADQVLNPGFNKLSFTVPAGGPSGQSFARFRFNTQGGLSYTGPAFNGEVEDYELIIEGGVQEEYDFGDAPDAPYPTLYASNGARHLIDSTIFMGGSIDFEPDGQPDPNALGDDNDGNDDEDGVLLPAFVTPGQTVNLSVTVSVDGFFNGWIDFKANGTWVEPGDQIFADATVVAGVNTFTFTVPASAAIGNTFARFRYSTFQGLSYMGPASDGEVEDYEVMIDYAYKWIQHPDLSDYGMDVDATWDLGGLQPPHVLADDFLCDITGPLDNITIWGSWYHDHIPFMNDPDGVMFTLSIHEDIPDSLSPTGYSMPGNVIWFRDFNPGEFTAMLFASNLAEGWFDPVQPYYEPFGDSQCWMYSFDLQPGEFVQEGTTDIPKVYWLDVQAQPLDQDPECRFGWKTSVDHWNDNAVWGVGMEPYPGPWNELYHPATGDQLDMAFAITGSENPYILLDLKAFLEGPYNGTNMDPDLNINNVIPVAQPYNADPVAPWYYTGAEIVSSVPHADIVDWVMVELRDAATPGGANSSTIIAQKASFIQRDGKIVAVDGSSYLKFYTILANNLYIALYHRNHLGVMSANTIVPVGNLYSYDFTAGVGQVYGGANGHKDIGGGVWGLIGGDGKPDGQVNNGDKNDAWAVQAGSSGYKSADFNMDTQVNNGDKNDIWIPNVGRGSQIP
ncbi:MAG: hypothetical protein K8S16_06335 [Bacteroidales bacterium]|nr:hypothetical protein [Bacteroidales bacterium]